MSSLNETYYVGIDNGLKGAAALLPPESKSQPPRWIEFAITDKLGGGTRLSYEDNVSRFADLLQPCFIDPQTRLVVVLEKPLQQTSGARGFRTSISSLSSTEGSFQILDSVIATVTAGLENKRIYAVFPITWKAWMGLTKKKNAPFTDHSGNKMNSVGVAKQLFPNVDIRRNKRCRVDFDGAAEALLIAEGAKRQERAGKPLVKP